jgi:uncharacterized protein (DUF1800 family)
MAADNDTIRKVGHLLRRAGFGATPDELQAQAEKGVAATVEQLVEFDPKTDDLETTLDKVQGDLVDLHNLEDIQTWWLYRMLHSSRPLQEKMTLFWHGHFATAQYKVNDALFMHQQNQTFRSYALGNFKDLTMAVAKDPAMLLWLDGNTNRKGAPNENFARELMELFTLGLGSYTEDDVKAGARAFTGWNLNRAKGQFVFNKNQHDDGEKTFRGMTGNLNGDDVIDNVTADPATAKHLARKLFAFFAYDNPEPEVVQPFADLYLKSGLEIKPVVKAILLSDAFYSDTAFTKHIKSPVEYVVGTIRQLGGQVRERALAQALRPLGQELFNPPNVAGWPGGPAWLDAATLASRFNFGAMIAAAVKGAPNPNGGGYVDPESFVQKLGSKSWDAVVDLFGGSLTGGLSTDTRSALLDYASQAADTKPQTLDTKLRGLVHLLMVSPEYQVA